MEQMDINRVGQEVLALKKVVEEMKNLLLENSLDVSDEVILEIQNSRKAPKTDFVSHEDILVEFKDDLS